MDALPKVFPRKIHIPRIDIAPKDCTYHTMKNLWEMAKSQNTPLEQRIEAFIETARLVELDEKSLRAKERSTFNKYHMKGPLHTFILRKFIKSHKQKPVLKKKTLVLSTKTYMSENFENFPYDHDSYEEFVKALYGLQTVVEKRRELEELEVLRHQEELEKLQQLEKVEEPPRPTRYDPLEERKLLKDLPSLEGQELIHRLESIRLLDQSEVLKRDLLEEPEPLEKPDLLEKPLDQFEVPEKFQKITLEEVLEQYDTLPLTSELYEYFLKSSGILNDDEDKFVAANEAVRTVADEFRKAISKKDNSEFRFVDYVIGSQTKFKTLAEYITQEMPYVDVKAMPPVVVMKDLLLGLHKYYSYEKSTTSTTSPPSKGVTMLEYLTDQIVQEESTKSLKQMSTKDDILNKLDDTDEFRFTLCKFVMETCLIQLTEGYSRLDAVLKALWNYMYKNSRKLCEERKAKEEGLYRSIADDVLNEVKDILEQDRSLIPDTAAIFRSIDCCRELDQYQEAFMIKKIVARIIPTLTFHPTNNEELLSVLCSADSYNGMIITSVRTIEAIRHCLDTHECKREVIESWTTKKNFAVYGRTIAAAEWEFGSQFIGRGVPTLQKLISQMNKELLDVQCKPYFYPHSHLENIEFVKQLEGNGFKIHSLSIYETLPNPNIASAWWKYVEEIGGFPQYLMFFSPSCAQYVMQCLHLHVLDKDFKVIPIGQTTAKELKKFGFDFFFVPIEPGIAAFRNQLDQMLPHRPLCFFLNNRGKISTYDVMYQKDVPDFHYVANLADYDDFESIMEIGKQCTILADEWTKEYEQKFQKEKVNKK